MGREKRFHKVSHSDCSYKYSFRCHACDRLQSITRSAPIMENEHIDHVCPYCGDCCTIVVEGGEISGGDDLAIIG